MGAFIFNQNLVMTETNSWRFFFFFFIVSWRIWREWWSPATSNHRTQPHHHHPPLKLQNQDTTNQETLPPNKPSQISCFLFFLTPSFHSLTHWHQIWIFLALPMEECSRFGLSKLSFLFVILISFLHSDLVVEGAHQDADSSNGLCNTDLSSFLPFPYSNLPDMVCKPLWNSYLLRVSS